MPLPRPGMNITVLASSVGNEIDIIGFVAGWRPSKPTAIEEPEKRYFEAI